MCIAWIRLKESENPVQHLRGAGAGARSRDGLFPTRQLIALLKSVETSIVTPLTVKCPLTIILN